MDLRREARGRECQIRIPSICTGDSETVVLCHLHKPSISGGTGLKGNDLVATWGCRACHDVCDGRSKTGLWTPEAIKIWFYEGICRTIVRLSDEGKITIGE